MSAPAPESDERAGAGLEIVRAALAAPSRERLADIGRGWPPREPASARRAICAIGAGPYEDVLAVSAVGIEAYAALHGYDVVLCTEFLAPERPPSWSRIPLIQALLGEYELVVWIDADAMLVEVGTDIADELPPDAELGLVEHRWYGGERRSANAGVMALRSTEWTRALLDRIWAAEQFVGHAWWENAALLEDLGYVVPEDLSPPYRRPGSELPPQLALLDAAWNSTADESASPHPRIRHLGRRESVEALRDELIGLLPQLRCSVMAAVAGRDPGWTGRALSF